MERQPLTTLPLALREAGYEAASYRTCYERARDGAIPARRERSGRWTWAPEDLGAIADALDLPAAPLAA